MQSCLSFEHWGIKIIDVVRMLIDRSDDFFFNGKAPTFAEAFGTFSAQDWTRTSTPVKALPPQSSVSTNFTTWALRHLRCLH